MSDGLVALSSAGRDFAWWCLQANLKTLLLLGAALAADQLLARRLSPAWRIALYLAVFASVLVPSQATWTVPVWSSAPRWSFATIVDDAPIAAAAAAPAVVETRAKPDLWPLAVLGLYAAGVAALATAWARGARTLHGVLRAATPSPQDPTLLVSSSVGPLVAGVRHPRIVIPAWLIASESLPLILAHERAHIARFDPAFAFLLRVVCTVAWPVLPFWIAASRVRALMEHACDDHALAIAGAHRQENTMKYARIMLEVAQRSNFAAGSLAFGAALRSRINALRPARRWPAGLQRWIACLAPIVLLACSAARPGVARPAAADKNPSTQASDATRVAIVSVISGDVPVSALELGNGTSLGIVVTDRRELIDNFGPSTNARILAQPRMKMSVGRPAALLTEGDELDLSIRMLVEDSDPDTVRATLSYAEGKAYQMKPTQLQFKRGQACVISIPPATSGQEPRILIVTIDRPGEEANVGC